MEISMTKTLNWAARDAARPLSAVLLYFLAAALQGASNVVSRLAERAAARDAIRTHVQTVEFHPVYRESGAPEGALYINGELVGTIVGVTRL
jgi:hypothetical protein